MYDVASDGRFLFMLRKSIFTICFHLYLMVFILSIQNQRYHEQVQL